MTRPTETAVATEPVGDAVIIARSKDEPELFAQIFRRHAPVIQRYVTRRLGPSVAEDVCADVFLAAFRQRHRFAPDRLNARLDARPWLFGIATNLVGRHRRAEIRALKALERTGVDPVTEAFEVSSDARLGAGAVNRRLAAALAALRPVYRDALLLVAWGDLTYEEIAVALGVPVGTVRSRVNRARSRMRAALGGADPTSIQEDL
ncbi:RNA polymerase sigma factor [Dactylosporangium sp. NPDC050588]|uniref:RNA polymerase sigma factor n=1 Tax=Dactylosporangium sp. NPDC050588 TaxID=3157211 RepID=UPI003404BD63